MSGKTSALREEWHIAETIDDDGIYKKLKYRTVEQIGFWIRPAKKWCFPCPECQKKLKELLANAKWTLGNKDYEPAIELNNTTDEVDEDSWFTLEEHEATNEERKRIKIGGWEEIK